MIESLADAMLLIKTQADSGRIRRGWNGEHWKMGRLKELRNYVDHELAREILHELRLTNEEETDLVCSAIYHHDDKLVTDSPMDEVLKDADVIHHCMNDLSKPVKEKERVRFDRLLAEFGM